jgi:hypothetical protein
MRPSRYCQRSGGALQVYVVRPRRRRNSKESKLSLRDVPGRRLYADYPANNETDDRRRTISASHGGIVQVRFHGPCAGRGGVSSRGNVGAASMYLDSCTRHPCESASYREWLCCGMWSFAEIAAPSQPQKTAAEDWKFRCSTPLTTPTSDTTLEMHDDFVYIDIRTRVEQLCEEAR